MRMTRYAVPALLALAVGACSMPSLKIPDPTSPSGVTSTATATKPAATPSVRTPALPTGSRWVTAPKSHLIFAAPKAWVSVDATKIADPKALAVMKEALGGKVSESQLKTMLASIDVMVVDASGSGDNINVAPVPFTELPSADTLKLAISTFKGTATRVTDTTTTWGPARTIEYSLVVGSRTVYGAGLFTPGPDGFANLTVTARSAAKAAAMLRVIVPTLHAAP